MAFFISSDLVSIPLSLAAADARFLALLTIPLKKVNIFPLLPSNPLKPFTKEPPIPFTTFVATPTTDLNKFGIALNPLPMALTKEPRAALANLKP